MSKQEGSGVQKPVEGTAAKPAATPPKAGAAQLTSQGAAAHVASTHGGHAGAATASKSHAKGGVGVGAKAGCHAFDCKEKDVRYSFCAEHFQQFKFGLITKTGEPVQDYDRKLEHYQKWLAARKAA